MKTLILLILALVTVAGAGAQSLDLAVAGHGVSIGNSPRFTGLRINAVDPGSIRTAMRAEAFPGEDPMTLRTPDQIADLFVELAEPACTRHGEIVRAY